MPRTSLHLDHVYSQKLGKLAKKNGASKVQQVRNLIDGALKK